MLRQTAHPTEPRYEVLALFTISNVATALLLVSIGTLLPYVALAFPEQRAHTSLLVTALMFGSMIMTIVGGAATDRFGDKAMLIACGTVMGFALIGAALIQSFTWLIVWFAIYGIGFAAVNAVGSHAILFFFKPEERGVAMGVRQASFPIGGIVGALLFACVAEVYGYRGALVAAGVLILLVSWICAALYRQPSELSGLPVRAGVLFEDVVQIAKEPRLLLLTAASVLVFAPQIALMGFLPLTFVRQAGITPALASVIFVVAQFAAIVGRLMWGWVSDRIFHGDRMIPLALNCVMASLAAFAVAHVMHANVAALATVALALGFTAEGWNGIAICAMAEVGGEKHAGAALGFAMTIVWAAGVVFAPAFQAIMESAGSAVAWEVTAVLALLGTVPAIFARRIPIRPIA